MLQVQLGDVSRFMPAALPSSPSRPQFRTNTTSGFVASGGTCGYGYQMGPNGVCMSQGCFDGRSKCVAMDGYGKTCSYDQILAFAQQSGQFACGPAPVLPAPPQAPVPTPPTFTPPAPGQVPGPTPSTGPVPGVDVSPSPGVQVTVGPDANGDYAPSPYAPRGIPRWAIALGGLTVVGIVIAVLAHRK